MIKIGYSAVDLEAKFIKSVYKRNIERFHKDCELVHFATEKDGYDTLNSGKEIAALAIPLENLSTTLPEGLVIAGLSARNACEVCLITFPTTSYSDALFNLPEKPLLAHWSGIIAEQFKEIIPTVRFLNYANTDEILLELETIAEFKKTIKKNLGLDNSSELADAINGGLVSKTFLSGNRKINDGELEEIPFDSSEITSLPGAGVVAFLAKADDVNTRRFLKNIHNPESGELTNIERKLKKMFEDKDIAAFCKKDDGGNYHLFAATLVKGQLKRCRLSQSTFFELAEKAYTLLIG